MVFVRVHLVVSVSYYFESEQCRVSVLRVMRGSDR